MTTEEAPLKTTGTWKKALRVTAKVLGWIVVGLLLLVVALYLFLQTGAGRSLVRRQVESRVSRAIAGSIRITEVESLSLTRIGLQGLVLIDTQGRPVVEIARIDVEPDLLALLRGRIEIDLVLIDQPQIHLFVQENGRLSLLDALAGSGPPRPPEPAETEVEGEPIRIALREIRLTNGLVSGQDPLWRGVTISEINLNAAVEISSHVVVNLQNLTLALLGADGELFRLDPLSAHLDTSPGATSTANLVLANAQDRIEAALTAVMPSEHSSLTLDGQVTLAPLTTTMLESLGLGNLQPLLPEWIRGQLLLSGPLDDLRVSIDLDTPGGPLAITGHASGPDRLDFNLSSIGLNTAQVSSALPPMALSWNLDAEVQSQDGILHLTLRLSEASLDGRSLTPLSIEATLDETGVSLGCLRLDRFGDYCQLSGRMEFDGSVAVTLQAHQLDIRQDPAIAALLPDLSIRLDGSLNATYQPGAPPLFSLISDLTIEDLAMAGYRAERLVLTGSAQGALTAPTVDLQLGASGLVTSAIGIQTAELRMQGTEEAGYDLSGQVQIDHGPTVAIDLNGRWTDQRFLADGTIEGTVRRETLRATLDGLVLQLGELVSVERLELAYDDSRLTVSGTYDFARGASLVVEIDRFDLALFDGRLGLPELPVRGLLDGHVNLSGQPTQPDVDLSISWRNGRVGPITRASADIELTYGEQELTASAAVNLGPAGNLNLTASAREISLSDLPGSLQSAPIDLSLRVVSADLSRIRRILPSVPIGGGSAGADIHLVGPPATPLVSVDLYGRDLQLGDIPPFDLQGAVRHDRQVLSLNLSAVTETGPMASLTASAEFALDRLFSSPPLEILRESHWNLEASVAEQLLEPLGVPLGPLADRPVSASIEANLQGRPGRSATGHVAGRLSAPAGRSGSHQRACPVQEDIDLTLELDIAARQTGLRLNAAVGERQAIRTMVTANTSLYDWIPQGRSYQVPPFGITMVLDDLDLSALPVVCSMASGRLDGNIEASGLLSGSPDILVALQASQLEVAGRPAMDLQSNITLAAQNAQIEIEASDTLGVIISLSANADFGLADLLESSPLEVLGTNSWRLVARIPDRSAGSLGFDIGPMTDLPIALLMNADLTAEAGRPLTGQIDLSVATDLALLPTGLNRCPDTQDLDLSMHASLEPQLSGLTLEVTSAGSPILTLQATAPASLSSWLTDQSPAALPPIEARLSLDNLDLDRLPLTCGQAQGTFQGTVELTNLFSDQPDLQAELYGNAISWHGGPLADLRMAVSANATAISGNALVEAGSNGTLSATFDAPWRWSSRHPVPSPGEGPLLAMVGLTEISTDLISPALPAIRPGIGRLNGSIRVEGTPAHPIPTGELSFRSLVVTVPGLDQRLTDVHGEITISPDRVTLSSFRARDDRGTIRLDGEAQLVDMSPTSARIDLVADSFPMRQSGIITAYLTARTSAIGTWSDEAIDLSVELREGAVRLPDQMGGSVQSLDLNPDILLDGAPDTRYLTDETISAEVTSTRPIRVHLDATSPFWVRRSDFVIQMAADLWITVDDAGTRISGRVDLQRGTLDLLTKTFELEAGTIQFDGGQALDPLLNLVAVHPLSRYPGESVSIHITGRLSHPSLTFSSTLPGVQTEAQIVGLLLSGRMGGEPTTAGSTTAGAQVSSILSGLTAGVLTLAARNALGDTLPVISVQTGEQLGDVQVRAGFAADRLIPGFMRGFVTGLYVEGFVQTEEEEEVASSQRRTTGGVLLELYFPLGFLISSSFQPPANWSLDLLWQR
ncbi:MAG: translocation/assembly module TamB domain-containing protein [Bradymonadales bacterium]|nr:translocation/assembly module TamB domain-containing protein [Bradymonadales bacterium]